VATIVLNYTAPLYVFYVFLVGVVVVVAGGLVHVAAVHFVVLAVVVVHRVN